MATAKTPQPFSGLFCPHCGAGESLNVSVETLALTCSECEEPITKGEIDALVAKWVALFGWLDAASTFAAPK